MALSHLWHLWPGRCWPALEHEEVLFVAQLRERATGPVLNFERGDYSLMLNALRCGITLDALMDRLPGVNVANLLHAYEDLDVKRRAVVDAWRDVEADPTISNFLGKSAQCGAMFSLVTSRVAPAAAQLSPEAFRVSVENISKVMTAISGRAQAIEETLLTLECPSEKGVALGRALYDPYSPGIWGDPYFIPNRVGTLTPVRVRALLGESHR